MIYLAALLLVGLLMGAERVWPAARAPMDRGGNLQAFLLGLFVRLTILPMVTLSAALSPWTLIDLARWPLPIGIVAFVMIMDLGEFAFHRAQHGIPWLWRMHAVHHSDPNMNVTTTERHFWGDPLLKALTIWPLAGLLLRPTPGIVIAYLVISLLNYVTHSNLRLSLGRWSWLINSPAYHRRHHSAEPAHYNCNFAALFPIFDVVFGSYRAPDGFPDTGLAARPRGLIELATWPLRAR